MPEPTPPTVAELHAMLAVQVHEHAALLAVVAGLAALAGQFRGFFDHQHRMIDLLHERLAAMEAAGPEWDCGPVTGGYPD
jgi:hypothetical protein